MHKVKMNEAINKIAKLLLGGIEMQKKQKKLGFFARKKTNILNRRRRKGRKALCK